MHTTREVKAVFSESEWSEQAYQEAEGVKLSRVRFVSHYRGEVEGRSVTELLMVYRLDGSVTSVGLERFEGKVLGQAGSFVIHYEGVYREGVAEAEGRIVSGTGTGELRSLAGEVRSRATHAPEHPVLFRLTLD